MTHKILHDRLLWAALLLALLTWGMPHLRPLFAALFPALDRPVYTQDSFVALVLAHLHIVFWSSLASVVVGVAAGVAVTRPAGREFQPLVETVVAIGQTIPPVAVLAIAAPLIGFGSAPALMALALYGLLPVVRATIAGIEAVPASVREIALGLGMDKLGVLLKVELALALPVVLSGMRTSVIVNLGTATIASTVGAKTLGSPIIVGLSGFNTAYVLQGAILVGGLAIVTDMAFARLARHLDRWH